MATLDPITIPPQSQLLIAMRAGTDGAITVNRLEAMTDKVSLTFAERGETTLWSMLREEFRRFISGIVSAYVSAPGLSFLHDLRFQMGSLSLMGLKVLSTRASDGRANLILRFSYVVGDINELFAGPHSRPLRRGSVSEKLLELTTAFFMPLRDISLHMQREALPSGGQTSENAGGRFFQSFFKEKLKEAEFAFFLLRRHIEDAERGDHAAREAGVPPETIEPVAPAKAGKRDRASLGS
ncbi:MAG: hypothetical protein AAGC57_12115 [Pseudomonadota bacterium]